MSLFSFSFFYFMLFLFYAISLSVSSSLPVSSISSFPAHPLLLIALPFRSSWEPLRNLAIEAHRAKLPVVLAVDESVKAIVEKDGYAVLVLPTCRTEGCRGSGERGIGKENRRRERESVNVSALFLGFVQRACELSNQDACEMLNAYKNEDNIEAHKEEELVPEQTQFEDINLERFFRFHETFNPFIAFSDLLYDIVIATFSTLYYIFLAIFLWLTYANPNLYTTSSPDYIYPQIHIDPVFYNNHADGMLPTLFNFIRTNRPVLIVADQHAWAADQICLSLNISKILINNNFNTFGGLAVSQLSISTLRDSFNSSVNSFLRSHFVSDFAAPSWYESSFNFSSVFEPLQLNQFVNIVVKLNLTESDFVDFSKLYPPADKSFYSRTCLFFQNWLHGVKSAANRVSSHPLMVFSSSAAEFEINAIHAPKIIFVCLFSFNFLTKIGPLVPLTRLSLPFSLLKWMDGIFTAQKQQNIKLILVYFEPEAVLEPHFIHAIVCILLVCGFKAVAWTAQSRASNSLVYDFNGACTASFGFARQFDAALYFHYCAYR